MAERLVPLVYAELRRVARACLKGERDHSLQPTALVHEAYLHLVDLERMTIHSRAHFCALAARLMRPLPESTWPRAMSQYQAAS